MRCNCRLSMHVWTSRSESGSRLIGTSRSRRRLRRGAPPRSTGTHRVHRRPPGLVGHGTGGGGVALLPGSGILAIGDPGLIRVLRSRRAVDPDLEAAIGPVDCLLERLGQGWIRHAEVPIFVEVEILGTPELLLALVLLLGLGLRFPGHGVPPSIPAAGGDERGPVVRVRASGLGPSFPKHGK